ncbi:MAG: hypothetical protein WD063_14700 [Pirellulales bacterium]
MRSVFTTDVADCLDPVGCTAGMVGSVGVSRTPIPRIERATIAWYVASK